MSANGKLTVKLGDKEFTIGGLLSLRQIQDIEAVIQAGIDRKDGYGELPQAIAVLRIGLSRDHKDFAAKPDEEISATKAQIVMGCKAILDFGGFVEAPMGEQAAAVGRKNSGKTSTAA
jgi:hypothetical protein